MISVAAALTAALSFTLPAAAQEKKTLTVYTYEMAWRF